MFLRPRGLSIQSASCKETAQMRRYAPVVASIAMLVAALFSADVTYWP
jgi:ABC-type transport system involved in cytochrome c biogenesis permease component